MSNEPEDNYVSLQYNMSNEKTSEVKPKLTDEVIREMAYEAIPIDENAGCLENDIDASKRTLFIMGLKSARDFYESRRQQSTPELNGDMLESIQSIVNGLKVLLQYYHLDKYATPIGERALSEARLLFEKIQQLPVITDKKEQ